METNTEMNNALVVTKTKKVKKQPVLIIEEDDVVLETKSKYDCFWEKHGDGKPSQTERYEKHNSPIGILRFIRIGGGPKMGITLENYARFEFSCLQKRDKGKNTGYDHKISLVSKEIYIEQKSS